MINQAIFRAYDIRGNSQKDITPEISYKIGFCFSKINISSTNKLICVGHDVRLSSEQLSKALICGLKDGGADIIQIGVVPTPVLYFADKKFNPAGSIMITGSHNPKDDNGFKMLANGESFFGDQIKNLYTLLISINWNTHPMNYCENASENQTTNLCNNERIINTEYVNRVLQGIAIDTNLKIAWDPGNGAACVITKLLQERLPNKNIFINNIPDGNFPNHHPDPTVPDNLKQLIEVVKSENCDFGIAFDGDADRIGIVDNTGEILYGDQILCLFAKDIIKNNPNATVIADVKTSQVVFDQIKLYHGNPIMWKTGHSFIKTKMKETKALLAGEMSGHIFFSDKYYGYDDAIYAALRLIDLCSTSNKSVSEMLSEIPKMYNTPEIRIKVDEEKKYKIIKEIKDKLVSSGIKFNDIDGIRVTTELGWWLLRNSNTEAALIIRCEAQSKPKLKKLVGYLSSLLKEIGVTFP